MQCKTNNSCLEYHINYTEPVDLSPDLVVWYLWLTDVFFYSCRGKFGVYMLLYNP